LGEQVLARNQVTPDHKIAIAAVDDFSGSVSLGE
jgi:hypothetical protein